MRAFIVRPFNEKEGIDFEKIQRELIDPALRQLRIDGGTTSEIVAQGNIREDMFQLLMTADLVIADITIHNDNVFYELGIRHALRSKRTFLVRGKVKPPAGQDSRVSFDILTERYLEYDPCNPGASVEALSQGLRATLASDRSDSPLFKLLPELKEQDRSRFMVVPLGFREDVERAAAEENSGDLELLGQEAAGFPWEVEGWRLVGRCQFKLKIYEGAKESWEAVRNHDPRDREANKLLATIYQRLKDYPRSSQAIQRVLDLDDLSLDDRAEAFALIGSNSKEEWRRELQEGDPGGLPARALQSAFLERSYQNYRTGFELNLNHFYSGLNALAMLTVQIELARALPEVWAEQFETPKEVEELERERARLAVAVEVSLESCEKDEQRRNKEEPWLSISKADLKFLTIPTAKGVAAAYRQALAGTQPFHRDAVRRQLLLYRQLGIRKEHVQAAMAVVGEPEPADPSLPKRVILFTGHRIDAPSRTKPRFPPEKEQAARSEIRKKVIEEKDLAKGEVIGIAGAASGGDILFHEVCEELNLKSAVFLALPQNDYCASSVQDAGPGWVDRFNRLCERSKPHVLGPEQELPRWLQGKKDYNIWQRSNLWMLSHSLTRDARNLTLIALWDGQAGDAPGGTSDMVERAKGRGAKFVHLDTRAIF